MTTIAMRSFLTVRSRKPVVIAETDNTRQTYLTNSLTISRQYTGRNYSTYVKVMDVSKIVDIIEKEETVQDTEEFEQRPEELLEQLESREESCPSNEETSSSAEEEREELPPPPAKRKKTNASMEISLLQALMSLPGIRLHNYGMMYRKYQTSVKNGKIEKVVLHAIFKILTAIGLLASTKTGDAFVQNFSKEEHVRTLSTTFIDARTRSRLVNWLKPFTTAATVQPSTSDTETKESLLPASMLPSPQGQTHPSPTYISSTIVDGRTVPAGVGPLRNSPGTSTSVGGPENSQLYRPKTSGFFRSMSFVKEGFRYSLRSAALDGDFSLKVELYKNSEVMGMPASDWWKSARMRAFVPVNENTEIMRTFIHLQDLMKEHLENQADAEGDYVQLRSFR